MKTKAETFWGFLSENEIEVPLIQRDYAQGRKGKEQLRKSFLADIKKSLDESDAPLTLDFVYGKKTAAIVMPLDGQQRLTTLWLLHWYLAYRSGSLNSKVISILKKFRYASRISSREFCERLSAFSDLPATGVGIREHIENQTWFRRQWRNDPTIQAMLGMLAGHLDDGSDGIVKIFDLSPDQVASCHKNDSCNYENCVHRKECYTWYWNILTGSECPITFYYLDLPGLKQTDSLYIKMNARGKPLTSFENFKADLIGFIKECRERECGTDASGDWNLLGDPKQGFSIKLDTDWTNQIFWPLRIRRGKKNDLYDGLWDGRIDDIIFAFFNRFCTNECALKMKGEAKYGVYPIFDAVYGRYLDYRGNVHEDDSRIAYIGFSSYKAVLDNQRLKDLYRIFDACDKILDEDDKGLELCYKRYKETYVFIPRYKAPQDKPSGTVARFRDFNETEIPRIETIDQKKRIVFFAFCQFFANEKMPSDVKQRDRAFKAWMRIVVNIVVNSDVGNISSMSGCLRLIKELSGHSYDILSYLRSGPKLECGTNKGKVQLAEEIEKARKILGDHGEYVKYAGSIDEFKVKDMTWEDVIDEVEQFAFFNGSIRFLYRDGSGNVDWSSFDIKWKNVNRYFDENGVCAEYRRSTLLLRAFLARIDPLCIEWFGNNKEFWRDRVLLKDECASVVAELLAMTDLTEANAIPNTVDVADWIRDETLLAEAISKDAADGEWHVLQGWRGCDQTLTRYGNRVSGNVCFPTQIIPLYHRRNEFLANIESDHKRGSKYYYGWDVDFKYNGFCFRWYGAPKYKEGQADVYLMLSGNCQMRSSFNDSSNDVENYYCFDTRPETTAIKSAEDFKKALDDLIEAYKRDSEKMVN